MREYGWDTNFIDEAYIEGLLRESAPTNAQIDAILNKARAFKGLTHREVASLIHTEDPEHIRRIFQVAGEIKRAIYGDRVVLFAPLYISDYCVNKCLYCSFRTDHDCGRKRLTLDEVRDEVTLLERMGHKRLAVEAGEDPVNCPIEYVLDVLRTIYSVKSDSGDIRRANVNIAATTVEEYRMLHEAGIGTYILFQETYHKPTYESVHLAGPKHDYLYHLTAFDRAQRAGIDDVGAGVLFGLYDYRFEIIALMLHGEHLEREYGVGFHTISVPRIRRADGADDSVAKYMPTDDEFKKLVAILRIAVPYTGMIISTRETAEMRRELLALGISQVSGGSSVEVGGYRKGADKSAQFAVSDERPASEVIEWLMDSGVVPSFCTACYRKGRTGDRFMALAKSGEIKNVCLPNALMTLAEYAEDYGSPSFREKSARLIDDQVKKMDAAAGELVKRSIAEIRAGKRNLYV